MTNISQQQHILKPLILKRIFKAVLQVRFTLYILRLSPDATRNEAEFDRSKLTWRAKMTNISQQQPINILKPLICGTKFKEDISNRIVSALYLIYTKTMSQRNTKRGVSLHGGPK